MWKWRKGAIELYWQFSIVLSFVVSVVRVAFFFFFLEYCYNSSVVLIHKFVFDVFPLNRRDVKSEKWCSVDVLHIQLQKI